MSDVRDQMSESGRGEHGAGRKLFPAEWAFCDGKIQILLGRVLRVRLVGSRRAVTGRVATTLPGVTVLYFHLTTRAGRYR